MSAHIYLDNDNPYLFLYNEVEPESMRKHFLYHMNIILEKSIYV